MSKLTETILAVFTLTTVYVALLTGTIPTPAIFQAEILPVLPWYLLVCFGSYSLGTLGWGILTFKDKNEKYHELLHEIDEAKAFLATKGLEVE